MFEIDLSYFEPKVKKEQGKLYIWGQIRKKYLLLTPEEWVRQALIFYLTTDYHYPQNLMQIESSLQYHQRQKRSDILVLNRVGEPFMLVECKAPDIPLTENVWIQALTYNEVIQSKYLLLTNGAQVMGLYFDKENKQVEELETIPMYPNEIES